MGGVSGIFLTRYSHRKMDKTTIKIGAWTLALVLLSVGITIQAAEIDYGGSLRLRFEDKIDFNLADAEQDFLLSQLRLYFSSEFDNRA